MNRRLFNTIIAQYEKHTIRSEWQHNKWCSDIRWSGGIQHCYLPSVKIYGHSWLFPYEPPTYDDPCIFEAREERFSFSESAPFNWIFRTPALRGIYSPNGFDKAYRDEWDYVTGKGLRRVKEIILDGEINKVSSLDSTTWGARIEISEPCIEGAGTGAILSTHFLTADDEPEEGYEDIFIRLAPDRYGIIIEGLNYSVNSFNEWLKEQYDAGTPVTVQYVLEKPIPFEERPEPYQPIPNDSGYLRTSTGSYATNIPFEITYVTYS